MLTFMDWLVEARQPIDRLTKKIERYIDRLYANGVEEERARQLTLKTFADDILALGEPRPATQLDTELGHQPPDYRKSASNFIRNYLRLVYHPEWLDS